MTRHAVTCQNVHKQCNLCVNNNKGIPIIYYKLEILLGIPIQAKFYIDIHIDFIILLCQKWIITESESVNLNF